MYAIIYWETDKKIKPFLNKDGTLYIVDDVEYGKGDLYINGLIKYLLKDIHPLYFRLISIEGIRITRNIDETKKLPTIF